MKTRFAVTVVMLAVMCFLFAGVSVCLAQGDAKVGQKEWSNIIDSKVAEQIGDNGIINYEDGYIEAVGIGAVDPAKIKGTNARPMCLRAAEQVARRNILEVVKGVQIDSHTTVQDFITESDVINTSVQGVIKGSAVVSKDYFSDGTCEVTVRMPLRGKFAQTIIPKAIKEEQKREAPAPPAVKPQPTPAGTPVYTGLVVDARGLGVRPAMSPKIVDETGAEVYGSMIVDKTFAVSQGISGYARDLTAAQGNQRVTNNPLTIKGVSAEGAGKSDIMISSDEAKQIRSVTENLTFMKKCRVMIVLD